MISPNHQFLSASDENLTYYHLETSPDHEQQRLLTLKALGLLDTERVPVFEEAAQTAAHLLNVPICLLSLIDQENQWFKAAIGLSRIGLLNTLASAPQRPRRQSFCNTVVETQHTLVIGDITQHPEFSKSVLAKRYGIRAYLGVPLIASNGYCLGTLAIMDLTAHDFTSREIEILELTARWSISEFERNRLIKGQTSSAMTDSPLTLTLKQQSGEGSNQILATTVKADLIAQMAQELRTPLTSILGMASVLIQEIYGPLTHKQKKYMDIVHASGQYMLSLVNEILELGTLDRGSQSLVLGPVDIEMLCQQAIHTLNQASKRREQHIQLTVEPGRRIWLLDKDKVRQIIYHLIFQLIQSSSACSTIRIHVSRRQKRLNISVWTSHPWFGEGLPHIEIPTASVIYRSQRSEPGTGLGIQGDQGDARGQHPDVALQAGLHGQQMTISTAGQTRSDMLGFSQALGLVLSRQLAELHGGSLVIHGSVEAGYRYVLTLPQMRTTTSVIPKASGLDLDDEG